MNKSSPKILLVDDEEELVTTIVERMQWRGLQAAAVTSGPAALERLRQEHFDVAVVDLKMPGINGLDLRDLISQEHPSVRVILATGHGRDSASTEALHESGQEILLKPFSIDVLLNLINRNEST